MERKYRQTLLTNESYNVLSEAKSLLRKELNRRMSLSDTILFLFRTNINFLSINGEIREYILTFVRELSKDPNVTGVVLFGSVAKKTFNRYSDIDLFIVVRERALDYFEKCIKIEHEMKNETANIRKTGYSLYVSPLVIEERQLGEIRPMYFDIADYGISLYDRKGALSKFLYKIAAIPHERKVINGAAVLTWK